MSFHAGNWWSYVRYDEEQDRPEVSPALLRRVAAYGKPYWRGVLATLLTIVGISLLSLVPPLLIRDLIDTALPQVDLTRLNLLALGMVAVPLASGLLGMVQRYASARIGEGVIYDLRRALFDHLQRMSLRFFTHTRTGELMSRLNNDVIGAQRAITGTVVTLTSNIFSLVATLIVMVSLEWRLTLISIAVLPLFVLPARRVGRVLRGITRRSMDLNAGMNAVMNESLNVSGALLVKIFGREPVQVDRFERRAAEVRDIGVRSAVVGRGFFLAISLVGAVGTALVFWVGGNLVMSGAFTIGTIVAFTAYLRELYGPLMALANARLEFATSMVSFERVFEVLDLPLEITERADAVSPSSVEGRVRFDNVSFRYTGNALPAAALEEVRRFTWHTTGLLAPAPARKKGGPDGDGGDSEEAVWALRDTSFEIAPGQVAALVGPSGAGKTTVTYLLPRLYDPTEGKVLLDGWDLRDLRLDTLSGHIGMVTQETYLFHDTIRMNLLFARPDARQEDLEEACRAANIHDFIVGLPEGYETVVGERGYRLSGGEKQRIAIARVILKDPRVLVLDEATSHLDSRSETLIQEAMKGIMRGRTSLVIAHRLSTVLEADLILVLDEGRLIERGTHQELMAQNGVYAQLYETQFRSEAQAAFS